MYRDSYIMALMVDGKIQKESDNGTVLVPFGSEYVIRLKNKLRKRAVADVWIDGKVAAQGIVVDANGTVDLERFVADGNLSEGKRFKLARLTDSKVDQPNDSENGSIEVNFYPEKDAPVVEKIIQYEHIHDNHYWYHGNPFYGHCKGCCNNLNCYTCYPRVTWGSSTTPFIGGGNTNLGITCDNANLNVNLNMGGAVNSSYSASEMPVAMNNAVFSTSTNSVGENAATVEGSNSLQKFSSVFIDVDHSKPTTIRLTVKGISKLIDICSCGFKRTKNTKYCPNDGTQLVA